MPLLSSVIPLDDDGDLVVSWCLRLVLPSDVSVFDIIVMAVDVVIVQ